MYILYYLYSILFPLLFRTCKQPLGDVTAQKFLFEFYNLGRDRYNGTKKASGNTEGGFDDFFYHATKSSPYNTHTPY